MNQSPNGAAAQVVRLVAGGDMMFYGPLAEQMARHHDLLWGLRPIADALRASDVLFGNLETPISAKRIAAPGAPDEYWAPPGIGHALGKFGFHVLNLAHNHILDFGAEGVETTLGELREAGVAAIGVGRNAEAASRPAIVTTGGSRVGFLGYTTAANVLTSKCGYVACAPELERVVSQVRELRNECDIVVVSVHTGAMFNSHPAPETRVLARRAIDAGASLLLGHHPHVPHGCEQIGAGLAVYSLGDFVGPVQSETSRRTFYLRASVQGQAVRDFECVSCYINDESQTIPATGALGEEIRQSLSQLSAQIRSGESDRLHFEAASGQFFSRYVSSWKEEYEREGLRAFTRKLRNLRGYHFRLMGKTLFSLLKRKPR